MSKPQNRIDALAELFHRHLVERDNGLPLKGLTRGARHSGCTPADARRAVQRLVDAGRAEFVQKGHALYVRAVRGDKA